MSRKERQRLRREAWRTLFKMPEGRRVFRELVREAGVVAHSHATTPHDTAYIGGKRAMGLWLVERLREVEPAALALLLAEEAAELTEEALEQRASEETE